MKKKNLALTSVFTALFAAIICVCGLFKIPLGPIPIVIQNAVCILTGAIMGSWLGGLPSLLFVIAGTIGLPVFSGGTGGIAVLMGPTGGFIPGYLLGAIVSGFIAGRPSVEEGKFLSLKTLRISLAILAGMIVLYIPGTIRFAYWAMGAGKVPADKSVFAYTMAACVIPYIPGDLLKIVVAIPVAVKVRPILAQYTGRNTKAGKGNTSAEAENTDKPVE